jgi:hypothetical protein
MKGSSITLDKKETVPFGMLHQEKMDAGRGYESYPESWGYDPQTQISELFHIVGGKSEPTTTSSIVSTGMINKDSDNDNDDKGTD